MLGFLHQNLYISSTSVKEQAYNYIVRSSLEYACASCDLYNKGKIDQLEMVQKHRAGRFITNRERNTSSVVDMLQHLNWCSLEDRCKDA